MKKKILIGILTSIMSLSTLGVVAVGVHTNWNFFNVGAATNDVPIDPAEENVLKGNSALASIKTTYDLGTEFSAPACYAEVGGEEMEMSHTVTYPDGRTSSEKRIKLDVCGTYTIIYTYQDTKYEKTFTVEAKVNTLFTSVGNTEISANVNGQAWNDNEINGVEVYVKGDMGSELEGTFEYNEAINLRNKTKNDAFIEFIGNSAGDSYAYGTVTITLTDAYDPDNYIVIEVRDGAAISGDCGHWTFVTAQANGMYKKVGYNQQRSIMHEHGSILEASASGDLWRAELGNNTIGLSYDTGENALYASPASIMNAQTENLIKVLDFDDESMVGNCIWNGFPSDMVYMSVTLTTRFQSDEGRLLITSLNGTSMSGESFEAKSYVFDVDTFGNDKTALPNGIKGKTYPAFDTTVYDNYGRYVGEADLKVTAPSGAEVPVSDGVFATGELGEYKLTYSCAKITATETLTVTVEETEPTFTYTLNTPVGELKRGDKVVISDGVASGNLGKTNVTVKVLLNGAEVETIDRFGEEYFYAGSVGAYSIVYTATDLLGRQASVVDAFEIAPSLIPVINLPEIGKMNAVGELVQLPAIEAVVGMRNGDVYLPVSIYFDGTDITATRTYTPTTAGVHTLTFKATFNGVTTEEEINVYASDSATFIENYLYLDGYTAAYGETSTLTASGSASMQFGLPILQQFLGVTISVDTWSFDNVTLRYTDSLNNDEAFELTIKEKNSKIVLFVNGEFASYLEESNTALSSIGLYFNPSTLEIYDGTRGVLAKVTHNLRGEEFKGFSSGSAYITMASEGEGIINLHKISADTVTADASDTNGPSFILGDCYSEKAHVYQNATYKVAEMSAYDVFSDCTLTVVVSTPDGTAVTLENNAFVASQLGDYTVTYTATDGNGNSTVKTTVVSVQQFAKPSLTVTAPATTATVGDTVQFADPSFYTDGATVYVYMVRPSGNVSLTRTENKEWDWSSLDYVYTYYYEYTFTEAGTHCVRYAVVDEYGNVYVQEFTVEVSENA